MAITFPNLEPQVILRAGGTPPEIRAYPITAAQTYTRGQIVDIVSGALSVVATNPATLTGLAAHDAVAVFQNVAGQPVLSQLFGTGQNLGTQLFPGDQAFGLLVMAHNGQLFEFSYVPPLAATTIGTAVGFTLTSGIFLADTAPSNKIAKIVDIAGVPQNIPGTGAEAVYQVGDIGVRVIVQITSGLTV